MSTPLLMFLVFIAITLGITFWAAKRSTGASAYFAAGRQIKGWQNGIAVAGDYMSAASFLGIAGIIAFQGYDGFMYSVGWLVAYLTVLLILSALSLFLFTAVAGRLWCGYACPQTVYTEMFLWIERKIEGDRTARMRLDESAIFHLRDACGKFL